MVNYWFPAYGHPEGTSSQPWFRVVDGWGYRTEGNPAGLSASPIFRIIDGSVFPTLSLPEDTPTFQIIGSFAYAKRGGPWFSIEERFT